MTRVVRKSLNHGISLSANPEASNPQSMASALANTQRPQSKELD